MISFAALQESQTEQISGLKQERWRDRLMGGRERGGGMGEAEQKQCMVGKLKGDSEMNGWRK